MFKTQKINLKMSDEILSGKFTNNLTIRVMQDFAILEFNLISEPQSIAQVRLIVTSTNLEEIHKTIGKSLEHFKSLP